MRCFRYANPEPLQVRWTMSAFRNPVWHEYEYMCGR